MRPASLAGRLALVLFAGLAAAHLLTVGWVLFERAQLARGMMLGYLGRDVASALAILDRVPPAERRDWLPRLARQDYHYLLAGASPGASLDASEAGERVRTLLAGGTHTAAGPWRSGDGEHLEFGFTLADGSPVTLRLRPPALALSPLTLGLIALQLALLAFVTWLVVRATVRPLARFAAAADALDLNRPAEPLPEQGPREVVRASRAFNAMRQRIADHLAERLRILAAISHDLQTPITRMRLRAELVPEGELRDKLQADLAALQALVEQGVAYAGSARASAEPACAVDLPALLDSLAADYTDAGQPLAWLGAARMPPVQTRPLALRRLVANLVDNAIRFAGAAELVLERDAAAVVIRVRDRGPGIPPAELERVLQPFHRLEASRNRDSGGTGLGLAIAGELAQALGATLQLANRPGGGLEASVRLPAASS